jgi:hypothetical protein
MFTKPSESPEQRLTDLRSQLAVAEAALNTARITRGSLEALRDGVAIVDPREIEQADAALLAARGHVQQLRAEVAEAEAAVKLERERPQREQGKRILDALAVDFAKDLKAAVAAMQRFASTLDRVPTAVVATLAPSSQQMLSHWMPASADFVAGNVPREIVERLRSYGNAMVEGQHGADLGLTVVEQAIAFGQRRVA